MWGRGGGGFRYPGARRRRASGPMLARSLGRLLNRSLMNDRLSRSRPPDRRSRRGRARRRFHALGDLWLRSRLGGEKILVCVLALLAQLRQLHRAEVRAQRGASALLPLGDRPAGRRIERARGRPLVEIEGGQTLLDLLLLSGGQVERLLRLSGSNLRPPVLLFRFLPRFRRLLSPRDARVFESGDSVLRHLGKKAVGKGVKIGLVVGPQVGMLRRFPKQILLALPFRETGGQRLD